MSVEHILSKSSDGQVRYLFNAKSNIYIDAELHKKYM